jgi:membrane associated rhomboid family serine protease
MPFRLRRPSVTGTIGLVTIATSLAITLLDVERWAVLFAGFIPERVDGTLLLQPWDALPLWVTPLSATLVHFGLLHLLFNMAMLLGAGRNVEPVLGARTTLLVYVVGAYAAAAAEWMGASRGGSVVVMMAGASGAISALIGAALVLRGRIQPRALPLVAVWALLYVAVPLMSGGTDVVGAWQAHIGGFVTGAIMALAVQQVRSARGRG